MYFHRLIVAVGLCLLVGVAWSQVSSTRDTSYDWRCLDAQKNVISDHQRYDTALIACLNDPRGAYVQGGRYRITKPAPVPVVGTATLNWTPPTQNTDGTALANLAGYWISYGTSATALTQVIQVANPGASAYTVSGLAPGTYHFAVRAYTSGGTESAPSNILQKTIQ